MTKGERLLLALAGALAVSVLAYAIARGLERALFPEPNPALVIGPERSGFAFRALTALYCGGMGGFGFLALTARAPRAGARGLYVVIGAAALALAAQAALAP